MAFRQYAWGLRQGMKAQLLTESERHVFVRKNNKFEKPQTNTFLSYAKKAIGGQDTPSHTHTVGIGLTVF